MTTPLPQQNWPPEDPHPRVYDPGLPRELLQKQEIMANGAYCGHILQSLAEAPHGYGKVRYPLDYFDEDEDPILTPDTEANKSKNSDNLPILAWTVSGDGHDVYVAVDMMERRERTFAEENDPEFPGAPPPLTTCKVIRGSPGQLLPEELLKRLRLI